MIASPGPIPKGGIESIRENLDAARAMVRCLLVKPEPEIAAGELGKLGGKETAKRGAEYHAKIASMRKERKGGRPKKHFDVLSSGALLSSVRSRSAFIIAKRARELGLDTHGVASAIDCSIQYTRNLMSGVAIPPEDTVQAIIKGLDLDNLRADQLKTFSTEDRRKNDGRFSAAKR